MVTSKSIDEMVQVGMHLGHRTRKWNPKMAPYIYGERNGIHIIDLIQTCSHLKDVSQFLTQSASQGKTFLFVGTKKPFTNLIRRTAEECDSFFINQRWLGGMLTNWKTIKTAIARLNDLEIKEQKGYFESLPKKEAATNKKEIDRLNRYLGGLKDLKKKPDVVIIVGQPEEMNAVRECKKLKIPSVTILDTDCDPTLADRFVPANDDSSTSLRFILNEFSNHIKKGDQQFREKQPNVSKPRPKPKPKPDKETTSDQPKPRPPLILLKRPVHKPVPEDEGEKERDPVPSTNPKEGGPKGQKRGLSPKPE